MGTECYNGLLEFWFGNCSKNINSSSETQTTTQQTQTSNSNFTHHQSQGRERDKENRRERGREGGKHEMNVWNEGIIPNRTKVIIVYPTVSPEVVIVPIVSSIFIFPIVAFLIICCLKKRAARARQKARLAKRETPYGDQSCASMARLSPPPHGRHSAGRRFTADVEMNAVDIATSDSYHCYHSVKPKNLTPTSSSQELVLGVLPILKVLETGMNSIRDN